MIYDAYGIFYIRSDDIYRFDIYFFCIIIVFCTITINVRLHTIFLNHIQLLLKSVF